MSLSTPRKLEIAICIATHRRPEGLKTLLDAIEKLDIEPLNVDQIQIVVVDNSADESARPVCEGFAGISRFPIDYLVETRRGECFARNRAVFATDAPLCAFIDDDEWPERNWLAELYRVYQEQSADMVGGPVIPFSADTVGWPPWVVKFYTTPRERVGSIDLAKFKVIAGTGNLLVRRKVFEELDPEPFRTSFGLSGGTDRDFLWRALIAGFTLKAAPDATVYTRLPRSRKKPKYLIVRSYDGGHSHMAMLRRYSSHWVALRFVTKGILGSVFWTVCAALSFWSVDRATQTAMRAAAHAGRVAAYLGLPKTTRYRTTDGG